MTKKSHDQLKIMLLLTCWPTIINIIHKNDACLLVLTSHESSLKQNHLNFSNFI